LVGALIAGTHTKSLYTAEGGTPNTGKSNRDEYFNEDAQRWDGVLPKNDDPGAADGDSNHYLVLDIRGQYGPPVFTNLLFDDRNSARITLYWDGPAAKLHVVSIHGTKSISWMVNYDPLIDDYSYGIGAGGRDGGITIPQVNRISVGKTFALTKTPNGKLWLFGTSTNSLKFQCSSDDGASWLPNEINLAAINGVGSVDCCWFTELGVNYPCVFASEDDLITGAEQYFFYIDEDNLDVTVPGNWINDSANIPALDAGALADDHVCMAVHVPTGKTFIVYKDSLNNIKFVTRTSSGVWEGTYEPWNASSLKTRPTLAIKDIDGASGQELIIFVTRGANGQQVTYRTTPLDVINFSASTVIIEDTSNTNRNFNDTRVIQGDLTYTAESGVLVIADHVLNAEQWYGSIAITAPQIIDVPAASQSITSYSPAVAASENQLIDVPRTDLNLISLAPVIDVTAHVRSNVPAASLFLTGEQPVIDVSADEIVDVPLAALNINASAPDVNASGNQLIDIPAAALGLVGYLPVAVASEHQSVNIPLAVLELSGFAPNINADSSINVAVPVAALSVVGLSPAVNAGGNQTVNVPLTALSLVANAPVVNAADDQVVDVPAATLTVTGYLPLIATGANITVDPGSGALTLTGQAPAVETTGLVTIEVPVAALGVTGYVPIIDSGLVLVTPDGRVFVIAADDRVFEIQLDDGACTIQ